MKSISKTSNGILVTGSSGFIGKHLRNEFARTKGTEVETREADILNLKSLESLSSAWQASTVVHLAGYSRVVAPVSFSPAMFATAIEGTLNVLNAFRPAVFILASTCAVYGDTGAAGAVAGESPVAPLGLYGLSRTSCERLAADWSFETGNAAAIMRFGNVIGPGCGGLIPYLVNHAVRHPDGQVTARLRGAGRIIRDYVPVPHVAKALTTAASLDWSNIPQRVFNIGSGRGRTNGEVAELVKRILGEHGYRLRIEYEDLPGRGESPRAILNVDSTTEVFGLAPPLESMVQDSIAMAVLDRLTALNAKVTTAVAG